MLEIAVTPDAIVFRAISARGVNHRRTYPNTPENYDRVSRMLDNRSAKPRPQFDLNSNRVFIRGAIDSQIIQGTVYYWVNNNEHLIDVRGVWYDARTDPQVISVLEMARIAAQFGNARLTITYRDGSEESGYVRFFNNGRRLLRLCYNIVSASGGVIWTDGIKAIRYSNKRHNSKERPYLYLSE